jgi:hypothetical protein
MTIETWLAVVAGVLLLLAAACHALAWRSGARIWTYLLAGTRLAGSIALAVTVIQAASARGGWSPHDVRQVALALGLATMLVYLALQLVARDNTGSPAVELVVAALTLLAGCQIQAKTPQPVCAPTDLATHIRWALFVVGSGAVITSGGITVVQSIGLVTTRPGGRPGVALPQWPPAAALQSLRFSLLTIGGGLILSAHWAWQTQGQLLADDPRHAWMAATWLFSAMSVLAWNLRSHQRRWATAFIAIATVAAVVGLLAIGNLRHPLGVL